ncbi:MAG TPA: hypothetical protein VGG97_08875 [Bryobacteraceae bacterium]|jgi:DNA-binding PadR family transcriptional regulator
MSKSPALVQGSLDLLLLKLLALEPLHGCASPYPALHKFEQKGWITAEWKPANSGGGSLE